LEYTKVEAALDAFGYRAPRGVGYTGRYLAYRELMRRFVVACEAAGCNGIDGLFLDAFFYEKARGLQKAKKSKGRNG